MSVGHPRRVCPGPDSTPRLKEPSHSCCFRPARPAPRRRLWGRIGPWSITNSNARGSPCACGGRNRRRRRPRAGSIVGFVKPPVPGPASSISSCVSPSARARSSGWIMRDRVSPSSTAPAGQCTRPPLLWRSSGLPVPPLLRPPGRRACRPGAARTCGPWRRSAGFPRASFPTTAKRPSPVPTAMHPSALGPTRTSRRTMGSLASLPGRPSPGRRPRWQWACTWWNAGGWPACGPTPAVRWLRSIPPSRPACAP
jgi:hypothetical protein